MTNNIVPNFKGKVFDRQEDCLSFKYNFGAYFHGVPRMVVFPDGKEDIGNILKFANQNRIPVAVRGGGFSVNESGVSDNGILLILNARKAEFEFLNDGDVEVSGRTNWNELEISLNKMGLSTPVLTSQLNTTVAGTLCTGGYGHASIQYGSQLDQVKRLRIILPNGESLWCSPFENSNYFKYAMATRGQLGIIDKVVLKTIPYKKYSAVQVSTFSSLRDVVRSLRWVETNNVGIDYFTGYMVKGAPNKVRIFLAKKHDEEHEAKTYKFPDIFDYKAHHVQNSVREDFLLQELNELKVWNTDMYHAWLVYTISIDHVESFADYLTVSVLQNKDIPQFERLRIFAGRKPGEGFKFPFEACPANSYSFRSNTFNAIGFGFSFHVEKDEKTMSAIRECAFQLEYKCLSLQGRPYSVNTFSLEREKGLTSFDKSRIEFSDLKRKIDPNLILNRL